MILSMATEVLGNLAKNGRGPSTVKTPTELRSAVGSKMNGTTVIFQVFAPSKTRSVNARALFFL